MFNDVGHLIYPYYYAKWRARRKPSLNVRPAGRPSWNMVRVST